MQTNYLSIIPVISKFEIPKGFGVIDKNVQNVATVHMQHATQYPNNVLTICCVHSQWRGATQ